MTKSKKKTAKVTDISSLVTGEVTFEIPHPNGSDEPVGIRVTQMAATDDRLKTIKRRIQNDNIARNNKRKNIKASEIEYNENILLASTVTGWDWYGATDDGDKPEFSTANVIAIMKKYPWFRAAINENLEDDAAFLSV